MFKYLAPLLLAGCTSEPSAQEKTDRGLLRVKLDHYCLDHLPAGPNSTQYNDWDEVVDACDRDSYYQANGCEIPKVCLQALFPEKRDGIR